MNEDSKPAVWNQRYATDEYVFGTEPSDILTRHAAILKAGDTALTIADGEGRNGVYLASRGLLVTSFDISPVGIAKANRLASERHVALTMLEGDIHSWPWQPEAFDVVAGIFFQFLGPAERTRAFAGIVKTLKSGGLMFLRGYTLRQHLYKTGGPSQVENLYTPELLMETFSGFDMLHFEEKEVELREGPRHTGMSAFVDVVGRKQ